MSQLKEITIVTQAGGSQTLRLQDYDNDKKIEYWSSNDRAISGKIRHNLRGARGTYHLRYQASVQPALFRDVINNIISDLISGQNTITIIEDGQYRTVVPTDSFMSNIEYANQVGRYVPDMEFEDAGLNRMDGQYIETGYITEGYIE